MIELVNFSVTISKYADILEQGGTTHIVYQDNSAGSYDIFYKRR